MRSRVEACGFQVPTYVRDDRRGLGGQRDGRACDEPVDVVDPEPDPFQMEGSDRAFERFPLFEQGSELRVPRRVGAQQRQQVVEAALRRLAVIVGHGGLHCKITAMEKGRPGVEPPDLSEKGGLKDGQPQRSDERLFMQLLAFGGCRDAAAVGRHLEQAGIDGVVYEDAGDPGGIAVLTLTPTPETFVESARPALSSGPCAALTLKPEFTMLGRSYSLGYEPDLRETLIDRPRRTVLNPAWRWAIWYPLRRSGSFAQLPEQQQRTILAEHGAIGKSFGAGDYAHDVRLACHGLDRADNDFVIGLIGRELFPLSALVQAMRKTQQTALYLDRLGPFFVGRAIWQARL